MHNFWIVTELGQPVGDQEAGRDFGRRGNGRLLDPSQWVDEKGAQCWACPQTKSLAGQGGSSGSKTQKEGPPSGLLHRIFPWVMGGDAFSTGGGAGERLSTRLCHLGSGSQ
jgi:hypothetical protein